MLGALSNHAQSIAATNTASGDNRRRGDSNPRMSQDGRAFHWTIPAEYTQERRPFSPGSAEKRESFTGKRRFYPRAWTVGLCARSVSFGTSLGAQSGQVRCISLSIRAHTDLLEQERTRSQNAHDVYTPQERFTHAASCACTSVISSA